jgi:2-polyprenyl-3-methyl-5-hydroxy-6-metoxy-1,4-benzoquinol methylase
MYCRICNQTTNKIFNHIVLNKYNVDYFFCESCKFIQTEAPYWLTEAYQNPIALIDTGIVKRNLLFVKRTATLLYFLFDKKKTFLDFGGGYGIFVRMMRDIGFDFYWKDKFAENIVSKGFEFSSNIEEVELLTSLECFEHFINPLEEISNMLNLSGSILFSTQIFHDNPPKPEEWWYYNFEAGQHISIYSDITLKQIAK